MAALLKIVRPRPQADVIDARKTMRNALAAGLNETIVIAYDKQDKLRVWCTVPCSGERYNMMLDQAKALSFKDKG